MPITRVMASSNNGHAGLPAVLDFEEQASAPPERTTVSSGNSLQAQPSRNRLMIQQIQEIFESAGMFDEDGEEQAGVDGSVENPFYVRSVNNIEGGSILSPGNASMESYAPLTAFPRTRRDQLHRVDYWMGNQAGIHSGDDLLSSLMQTKTEFTALGMDLRMASDNDEGTEPSNEEKKFKKLLRRIKRKWGWQKLVEDLLMDWFTKDTMILYWKITNPAEDDLPPAARSKEALMPGLVDMVVLNPAECDWDNSFGTDTLKYKIPKDLETKIRSALNIMDKAKRLSALTALKLAGVENKYILAVDSGKEYVTFSKNDGDRWIVVTRERNRNGVAKPRMRLIFDALESRKCVKEGEFTAAYMMKHFIFHATTGESITQGNLAGMKNNWAKPKDIDKLYQLMVNTAKAQRIATNHTVKFAYIFPPADMWDRSKYETPEARIYNFAGVNLIVMSGQGGTNAGGYLGIKRMVAAMSAAREKIDSIIYEFFDDEEIREICKIPDDVDVTGVFDENALKEPKQLLDEIKFLLSSGPGDPKVALSELGRDPASMRDAKLASIKDNNVTKVYEPVFQPKPAGQTGQRQVKQEGKGRPPKESTTQNEGTRSQSPRSTA